MKENMDIVTNSVNILEWQKSYEISYNTILKQRK